jgi:beta-glucuronidase
MIRGARNHPSVAIYSIGNECNTANPEAGSFFTKLAQSIRSFDPSRLISYAALYGIVGPVADIVDILGVNSYYGWYDKVIGGKGLAPEYDSPSKEQEAKLEPIDLSAMNAMLDKIIREAPKDLLLLLTEFGADSVPGYYASGRNLWSETYHADVLSEIFTLARGYPRIAGTFPFCFSDYRDPSKHVSEYWDEMNYKGAVTYHREKKLAFQAIRKGYTGK